MIRSSYTLWILGGIALLIIIAGACYLWYQHSLADERKAASDAQKLLRQSEIEKSEKSKVAEQAADAPADSTLPTADKQSADATALTDNTEASQTGAPAQNAETAEVRVSKFGFGPYPELPPDFPWQDIFDPPYYTENPNMDEYKDNPNYELMDRLWVELWKRGEKVEGFSTRRSTGLFYPTIRGTVYVDWGPRWKVFGQGIGRRIRYIKGHPDDLAAIRANRRDDRPLLESDIPSDIKILDLSEGIDPYTFLDLPRP